MKDAPQRPGMGYFDRDCATVEVDVSDPSLRLPQRPSVQPAGRSVPPPVPSRNPAHDPAAVAQAQALAQMSHMQQLQMQQQMQLQQLQQMQLAQHNQTAAAYAVTARSVVDAPAQAQTDSDNRLKFLLFGLAIGAVVVLVLSGNGLSNLRARLAYALMPDAPSTAPVQTMPLAPVAAAPVAPPPTAIPVVTLPPQPVAAQPVAPRPVPEVDVTRLPKSSRGSRVARKATNDEAPTEIAPPPSLPVMQPQVEEPPVPGADVGIDMKAFQQLGKAFKTD